MTHPITNIVQVIADSFVPSFAPHFFFSGEKVLGEKKSPLPDTMLAPRPACPPTDSSRCRSDVAETQRPSQSLVRRMLSGVKNNKYAVSFPLRIPKTHSLPHNPQSAIRNHKSDRRRLNGFFSSMDNFKQASEYL